MGFVVLYMGIPLILALIVVAIVDYVENGGWD